MQSEESKGREMQSIRRIKSGEVQSIRRIKRGRRNQIVSTRSPNNQSVRTRLTKQTNCERLTHQTNKYINQL